MLSASTRPIQCRSLPTSRILIDGSCSPSATPAFMCWCSSFRYTSVAYRRTLIEGGQGIKEDFADNADDRYGVIR